MQTRRRGELHFYTMLLSSARALNEYCVTLRPIYGMRCAIIPPEFDLGFNKEKDNRYEFANQTSRQNISHENI